MIRKKRQLLFGTGLSIFALAILFIRIPLNNILKQLVELNPTIIGIAFFIYFAEFAFPALRFFIIGRKNNIVISLKSSYTAVYLGAFGNYILPMRTGEIIKALYLQRSNRQEDFGKAKALGMLFWERAVDFILIFVMLVFMLGYYGILRANRTSILLPIAICVGLLLSLSILMTENGLIIKILKRLSLDRRRIVQGVNQVFCLFKEYRDSKFIIKYLFLSIIYWLIVLLGYILIFLSAGIRLSLDEALLFLCIVTMGFAIPSGPGSVGVLQGAFVLAGSLIGIEGETAMTLGIIYQVVQATFCITTGLPVYLINRSKFL